MKNKVVIAIPVYKETMDSFESLSLRQCLKVLGNYDICLFGPDSLNLSEYRHVFETCQQTFQYIGFASSFFESQRGYNRLMLTKELYLRFRQWEYLLIYQLDAYVFQDELMDWCNKGYDYIGAPFLKLNREVDWNNCGNGGFSLRKIASFIRLFEHEGRILTWRGIWRYYRYRGPLHRLPMALQRFMGKHNRVADYTGAWLNHNEDLFYAMLGDSTLKWKIPSTREAMYFSFEERPSYLYRLTGRLPFGCHAFLKNEYQEFYKEFIHE
ncbi:DUF5672 family protein [Phocaeicola faecicola]|uniref:DUF5672 family protein n=1 Tax=Phocaeicola faecicola TaxID=2739389 RepID=UPI0015E6DFB8|nr:DUF5672 family protein [Phocaeicola faecicola]